MLIHAEEENGAEYEEGLAESIINMGNIYWSVINSTCTDSFYTVSILGGTHLYNYDISLRV